MFADEIQRIDSIVKDISQIRKSYEAKLLTAKEKNILLQQKVQNYNANIKKLENQINQLKNMVKTKEYKEKKPMIRAICEEDNLFPKLKMKNDKILIFKPSAFRLKNDANIYASSEAVNIIANWEKERSFTSNEGRADMIKITGYFVNKVWTKAENNMWIRNSDTIKRVRDK